MVELPAVDVLQGILGKVIPDCSQMQAKLSDVLEAHLIANRPVNRKQLNEAVLRSAKAILNVITSAARFASSEELIIHALKSRLIKCTVLSPHDQ